MTTAYRLSLACTQQAMVTVQMHSTIKAQSKHHPTRGYTPGTLGLMSWSSQGFCRRAIIAVIDITQQSRTSSCRPHTCWSSFQPLNSSLASTVHVPSRVETSPLDSQSCAGRQCQSAAGV